MEQWRKRGREIVANWLEKNPDSDIHPHLLMGAMKQWGLKKMGKKIAAIRFMLWQHRKRNGSIRRITPSRRANRRQSTDAGIAKPIFNRNDRPCNVARRPKYYSCRV